MTCENLEATAPLYDTVAESLGAIKCLEYICDLIQTDPDFATAGFISGPAIQDIIRSARATVALNHELPEPSCPARLN